jgi:uncharacterized membrane protein
MLGNLVVHKVVYYSKPPQMIAQLRRSNRINITLFLAFTSFICLGLSLLRVNISESRMFLFLNWNLFLAFIPWALSSVLLMYPKLQQKKRIVFALMCVWILFFPNAPYILTDLFHLKYVNTMPMWFDLLLILSFAWVGLLFGFLSLWDIEKFLEKSLNKKLIPILSSCMLFLGSFGIYLGRYLRWNSWDIMQQPLGIIYDIGDRVINPFEHPRTWGVTLFMGLFLNVVYWSLRLIKHSRTELR